MHIASGAVDFAFKREQATMEERERLDYRHFSVSQSTADMELLDWSDISPSRRKWTLRRALIASLADEYASALVFVRIIFLNIDSFLAAAIAIASPCFYYYYTVDGRTMTFSLSWTMVSGGAEFLPGSKKRHIPSYSRGHVIAAHQMSV
jgi:hypothetical protein